MSGAIALKFGLFFSFTPRNKLLCFNADLLEDLGNYF